MPDPACAKGVDRRGRRQGRAACSPATTLGVATPRTQRVETPNAMPSRSSAYVSRCRETAQITVPPRVGLGLRPRRLRRRPHRARPAGRRRPARGVSIAAPGTHRRARPGRVPLSRRPNRCAVLPSPPARGGLRLAGSASSARASARRQSRSKAPSDCCATSGGSASR